LPPSEFVEAPSDLSSLLARELEPIGVPIRRGPVWTTDAPYRETAEQIRRHSSAGVLAVEMQAASLFALAAARSAQIGIVAHVTNAADHEGKDFDKGSEQLSFEILGGIARAGSEIIRVPTEALNDAALG
jgi:uridine phosphorylase